MSARAKIQWNKTIKNLPTYRLGYLTSYSLRAFITTPPSHIDVTTGTTPAPRITQP